MKGVVLAGGLGTRFLPMTRVTNKHEIMIMELAMHVKDRVGSASETVVVPYDEAYGEGFEDMERRELDLGKIRGLVG